MENLIDAILSNQLYLIITAGLVIALIFFVIKKMIKLLLYASIVLIAFLGYLIYSEKPVTSVVVPAQKAVEKAEQTINEKNKELQEVKKKVEKELKK